METPDKSGVKKQIRALKAKRDEAIGRKAAHEVTRIRRGIRTLKRRSRDLARAAKAQAAAATPPAAAAGALAAL